MRTSDGKTRLRETQGEISNKDRQEMEKKYISNKNSKNRNKQNQSY